MRLPRFRWRKDRPDVMRKHAQGEWVTYREHAAFVRELKAQFRAMPKRRKS